MFKRRAALLLAAAKAGPVPFELTGSWAAGPEGWVFDQTPAFQGGGVTLQPGLPTTYFLPASIIAGLKIYFQATATGITRSRVGTAALEYRGTSQLDFITLASANLAQNQSTPFGGYISPPVGNDLFVRCASYAYPNIFGNWIIRGELP